MDLNPLSLTTHTNNLCVCLSLLSPLSRPTTTGPNGHGGDVKCVDWHPVTSLLASCGRDAMIKLWDCRHSPDTAMLATLQGHKQAVNKVCGCVCVWCEGSNQLRVLTAKQLGKA